jgi:hypothetical protein
MNSAIPNTTLLGLPLVLITGRTLYQFRTRCQPELTDPPPRGLSRRGVGNQLIDNVGEATAPPQDFALSRRRGS